jgi:hypothetical protein
MRTSVPEETLQKLEVSGIAAAARVVAEVRAADSEAVLRESEAQLGTLVTMHLSGDYARRAQLRITNEESENLVLLTHKLGWKGPGTTARPFPTNVEMNKILGHS